MAEDIVMVMSSSSLWSCQMDETLTVWSHRYIIVDLSLFFQDVDFKFPEVAKILSDITHRD